MAFMSSSNNNTSSTNRAINTAQAVNIAHRVSTASTQVNDAYSTNINNSSDQCISIPNISHAYYFRILSEISLIPNTKWSATIAIKGDILLRSAELQEIKTTKTRKAQEGVDLAEEGPNYALMAFSSLNYNSEVSNDSICSKTCLETVESLKSQNDQLLKDLKKYELMVLVLPPYTGNFMPPKLDLSFTGLDEFVNKPVVENSKAISSEEEPKVVRKSDDAPIIKEWVSDDEE
ncbi:hypothetical protein Tco_0599754 [Tanacetum coccineum]